MITQLKEQFSWAEDKGRRELSKRRIIPQPDLQRRKNNRRLSDLLERLVIKNGQDVVVPKIKTVIRNKFAQYKTEVLEERRLWLQKETGTILKHVSKFSEPVESMKGKIENPIGVVHVPLGIAGPLLIDGEEAKGVFYVPMATSEGALITSYTLGMNLVTRAGGVRTQVLQDELRVSPVFVFETMQEAQMFLLWLKANFQRIKEEAEKTTGHGKLIRLEPLLHGHRVILKFWYSTGDAMGMNMICKATEQACKLIRSSVRPTRFYLRSNYGANKKVAFANVVTGYGKTVTADVIIPRRLLRFLNTTPEGMEAYYRDTVLSGLHAGMVGSNGHFANGITAIFIACGQDVATVPNASVGISFCETTKQGDLYVSVHVPNLLVGTVGGGTEFGTAQECLRLIDCFGNGKAKKFAEIIAATTLAGEISICASIVNGTYVYAHEIYGRNRPS